MSEQPKSWGTPAEEHRDIARDCARMGRPDLAVQFLVLAEQEERQAGAMSALFGDLFTEPQASSTSPPLQEDGETI